MVTLKDIAAACDVSIATVSRVLNHDLSFKIKRETRALIIKTAADMQYKKEKALDIKSLNVALVQWISQENEKDDAYYYEIRKSVEYQCYFHDIYLNQFYIENIDSMKHNENIDAIICIGKFSQRQINFFQSITPNIIFIDSNPDEEKYTAILYDLEYGMEKTVDYLKSMGHKKIAYIGGREYIGSERKLYQDARERKFNEMIKQGKISVNPKHIYLGSFDYDTGYSAILSFLKESTTYPTAIICANDLIAQGAKQAILDYKVEDISLTSFNNILNSKASIFTTVDLDTQYVAVLAISQLINAHVMNQYGAVKILIKPKLIIRESVKRV